MPLDAADPLATRAMRIRRGALVAGAIAVVAVAGWAARGRIAGHAPGAAARADARGEGIAIAPTRGLEVRLTYAAADRHRPYDVARSAGRRSGEAVPLATLAALEAKGDAHGVSAGLALSGDLDRAEQALERAGDAPDVQADRAALALARGKAGEGLERLDLVLAKNAKHPQAAFNRAIALRELGLLRAAADAFDRAAALGEAGWSEEARARGAALHAQVGERDKAWSALLAAGQAMAQGGPVPGDAEVSAAPDLARHFLYHAVRGAPSRARVLELRPLALALDARAGGHVLATWVDRAAAGDAARFAKRAPLTATYARLVTSAGALSAEGKRAYLQALRAAGETDMLLGAIPLADASVTRMDEYDRLAQASGDPWFVAVAAYARGSHESQLRDFARAEATLRRGVAACSGEHVDYRCAMLEFELATVLGFMNRTTEARALVVSGLARTRATASDLDADLAYELGDLARLEVDRSMFAATMREAELAAPDRCDRLRLIHVDLAIASVIALDADGAAAEIARTPRCGEALSLAAADSMVDAARMGRPPEGIASLASDLAVARQAFSPGERVFADVIESRLRFVTDAASGEAQARRALADAARLPASDLTAKRAEAYAHRTLAFETARAGRAEDALSEIARGARLGDAVTSGPACVVGLAIDNDRALTVTRDGRGAVVADVTTRTSPEIEPEGVVSPAARARLAGCREVRVLALAPLHGLPRVLPADVAWSYASGARADAPPAGPPRRVVVSDVSPPAALGLAALGGWSAPASDATWLHGASATPSHVLAGLADATEIEIHAHGFVDGAQTAASLIALSPEADGRYALTAADLEGEHLRGSPMVVLGACHAAKAAGYVHEAWGLPTAFVRAGARAVLASPSAIRDAEAVAFFDGVLARARAGASPASALRDERTTWLARDGASWVGDVIDFE